MSKIALVAVTGIILNKKQKNNCVSGRSQDKIKADAQEKGDLGIVAEVSRVVPLYDKSNNFGLAPWAQLFKVLLA